MTFHVKSRPHVDFRFLMHQYLARFKQFKKFKQLRQLRQYISHLWLKTTGSIEQSTTQQGQTSLTNTPHPSAKGCVYLIGAGAGDPELLTMKAYRLIQQADVILVDWLVDSAMYSAFPAGVQVHFVGKKCGKHSVPQQDICAMLVNEAQQGKVVVRLKGGDPSIFARLAEETDMLQAHQIPFAIVPGVTAASMCAAYSGIPLTHRDCAQSVQLVTAHRKHEDLQPNWSQLAQSDSTLVFYMGLNRIASIAQNLMKNGKAGSLPMAIVDQGGAIDTPAPQACVEKCVQTAQQTVLVSTLLDIQSVAMQNQIKRQCKGPALIIVGKVVRYRQQVDLALLASGAEASIGQ